MSSSGTLEEMIRRHVRRWELESRAEPSPPRPCIAISRQPYSGAADLAARVAEKLDYHVFGTELLDQIARQGGVQRRLLEALDERVRSAVERYVVDAFRAEGFSESDYLRHVVQTVAALSEQGGAVLLGRGAPFILPAERGLRVRVVAPESVRAARLARERGLPAGEAAAQLAEEDRERRRFIEHHFRVRADDPTLFDLVVNTAHLGVEGATATVLAALAHWPQHP